MTTASLRRLLAGLLLIAPAAGANVVYEFNGDQGFAKAQIIMTAEYVLGEDVHCHFEIFLPRGCNIAAFNYGDLFFSFGGTSSSLGVRVLPGQFNVPSFPGPGDLYMNPLNSFIVEGEFITHVAGDWFIRVDRGFPFPNYIASGLTHEWHIGATPEPGVLGLLLASGLAFVGVATIRRRKTRALKV